MDSNHLQVNLAEFTSAIYLLKKVKPSKSKALIAFDGRYLSVEVGSASTAMVAQCARSPMSVPPAFTQNNLQAQERQESRSNFRTLFK